MTDSLPAAPPAMRSLPPPRVLPAIVLGLLAAIRAVADIPSEAFHNLTFNAASVRAASDRKIIFIDFYTTWCGPCKMLDETTWQDPRVIALLQAKAIAIKIDAELETGLARRYKIEAYPTLLLLTPDGTELDRIVGYRPAEEFIEEFNAGLAGRSSAQRARDAVTTAATDHDTVKARYDLGKSLARDGKHEEALAEFLWCYDEGMVQVRSYVGVRSSFLLGEIMRLAKKYPPARAALVERRDKLMADLVAGGNDRRATADLGALNRALGENDATLALFDKLPAGDLRRRALGINLLPQLLEARRYTDALDAHPFNDMVRMAGIMTAPREGAPALPSEALAMQRQSQIRWFGERLEILAGAGEMDHAGELLAKARAYDSSEAAESVYRSHFERAGRAESFPAPAATGSK